ncbi:MAG: MBOAT family protein [Gammaproteobacteria bacterium]|nr:MBOAT family protein [Gammaproteobacteria bacterium]
MLFNSFFYILIFLPGASLSYFLLANCVSFNAAKIFLVLASFLFYGWWNPIYLPLLILSILINYIIAHTIQSQDAPLTRKYFLVLGVLFNLGLLSYFKYTNFFVDNINIATNSHLFVSQIILPLGISFFTFTQIAFLVDFYRDKGKKYSVIDYCLFVSYFPHLLAGPIIHHAQMMPQFSNPENGKINYQNIYFGLALFIIGLTKKVVLADTFALFANDGYSHVNDLNCMTAWITSLAYTFQIYFDFSGYTDMAIGASKLFNITLPRNFNSPYQALSIRDFWHRWHITLSHFLRDYLYIPLGGNRVSEIKINRNLILTFVLGGFWHGAGWTFIWWGLLHGLALSLQRLFGKLNFQLPNLLSWLITFNFINITWVFFRSATMQEATHILSTMLSFTGASFNPLVIILFGFAFTLILWMPNSSKIIAKPVADRMIFLPGLAGLMLLSIILMEMSNSHEFIYFKF